MWTVAIVPLVVLALPLCLQLLEARWFDPSGGAVSARRPPLPPADRVRGLSREIPNQVIPNAMLPRRVATTGATPHSVVRRIAAVEELA
jgi:hypothetical protein